mmetsp:Transcript_76073/g.199543  ORF Transcript_76073/g.199543 Transcript_76073/m.199543 type:complete len:108 (-) Transcript_76073:893-1216(-)
MPRGALVVRLTSKNTAVKELRARRAADVFVVGHLVRLNTSSFSEHSELIAFDVPGPSESETSLTLVDSESKKPADWGWDFVPQPVPAAVDWDSKRTPLLNLWCTSQG